MAWKYIAPSGEPPFWYRKAHEFEIEGLDPLTGLIIAYSEEECTELDCGREEQIAAHGQFGVGA